MVFLADHGCRDRAMLVMGSNTAKHAALTALLDPSTHFRPPLTHTSHQRPALVDLSRFIVSPILTHSEPLHAFLYVRFSRFMRFFSRRFSTECLRDSHGGEAQGHILASLSPKGEQGPIGKFSSRRTRSCNNPESATKNMPYGGIWASTLDIL
jgi:hypothetical protein